MHTFTNVVSILLSIFVISFFFFFLNLFFFFLFAKIKKWNFLNFSRFTFELFFPFSFFCCWCCCLLKVNRFFIIWTPTYFIKKFFFEDFFCCFCFWMRILNIEKHLNVDFFLAYEESNDAGTKKNRSKEKGGRKFGKWHKLHENMKMINNRLNIIVKCVYF